MLGLNRTSLYLQDSALIKHVDITSQYMTSSKKHLCFDRNQFKMTNGSLAPAFYLSCHVGTLSANEKERCTDSVLSHRSKPCSRDLIFYIECGPRCVIWTGVHITTSNKTYFKDKYDCSIGLIGETRRYMLHEHKRLIENTLRIYA